jgi:hypothetical protein
MTGDRRGRCKLEMADWDRDALFSFRDRVTRKARRPAGKAVFMRPRPHMLGPITDRCAFRVAPKLCA